MTNARIPKIDRDPRLLQAQRLLAEVADERCADSNDFWLRSKVGREVMADLRREARQV